MPEVDLKVVEEKIGKGEALTKEELKEVMSEPPEGTSNIIAPTDDIKDEDFHDDLDPAEKKVAADKAVADKKAAEDKAAADKKAADDKAAKEESDKDPLASLLKELDKPEGKEDLTNLSAREKGLFWEMRRDRKRAQKAEEERDSLRFEKVKKQKDDEALKAKEEEDTDPFKDRGDDEPLTIKDIKLMRELNKKKATIKDTGATSAFDPNSPIIASALKHQDELARKELGEDYDETVECTGEIISNNSAYLRQIADALVKGENVAKLTYYLIKGDPEYTKALPAAVARLKAAGKKTSEDTKQEAAAAQKTAEDDKKKAEALETQKKLEANQNKKKTSVHADGTDTGAADLGEYTIEKLDAMSDKEFRAVPKKIRDKFLKMHGA